MEDSFLIELYFARDEKAIVHTKEKYGLFLFQLAQNILNVKEDSEECVSDTYFKAWNEIPPQRPAFLKYWLGRITRNLSINLWNKNHASKRYAGLELILDELSECIPSPESVEEEINARELTLFINKWLHTLPEDRRTLFIRRYWFGDDADTLSHIYKWRPAKVYKELFELRKKLKTELTKEGYSI